MAYKDVHRLEKEESDPALAGGKQGWSRRG